MHTLLVILASVALGLSLGAAVTQAVTVTPTDDTSVTPTEAPAAPPTNAPFGGHAGPTEPSEPSAPSAPSGLDPILSITNTGGAGERRTFIYFDVEALLGAGTLLNKALLRVYVNAVGQAGDLNVLRVTSAAWDEATLTWANQPTGVLYTVVPVDGADLNHYVTVDV